MSSHSILPALFFILAAHAPALAQIRTTPKAAMGGVKQGEPWANVPDAFRDLRDIPQWPLPKDLKQWQSVDRAKTRATLVQCLGEMPPRPDPRKVKVLSREDQGEYLPEMKDEMAAWFERHLPAAK